MVIIMDKGKLIRIAGPVVVAEGIDAKMYDLCKVGKEGLLGEVIQIDGENTIIQVYEETSGLKPGEQVINTGKPLSVKLGPGLLTSIYDGIQRPLPVLREKMGQFIYRGVSASGLDEEKKWDFKATIKKGDLVEPGVIIGEVAETSTINHKIILPLSDKYQGKIKEIRSGKFTVNEVIGKLDNGTELKLSHEWPVRVARKLKKKLAPDMPLLTGQRIFDGLFPLAKGGVAAIPGPFGAGKTVAQQQLAKWSDADIVV